MWTIALVMLIMIKWDSAALILLYPPSSLFSLWLMVLPFLFLRSVHFTHIKGSVFPPPLMTQRTAQCASTRGEYTRRESINKVHMAASSLAACRPRGGGLTRGCLWGSAVSTVSSPGSGRGHTQRRQEMERSGTKQHSLCATSATIIIRQENGIMNINYSGIDKGSTSIPHTAVARPHTQDKKMKGSILYVGRGRLKSIVFVIHQLLCDCSTRTPFHHLMCSSLRFEWAAVASVFIGHKCVFREV